MAARAPAIIFMFQPAKGKERRAREAFLLFKDIPRRFTSYFYSAVTNWNYVTGNMTTSSCKGSWKVSFLPVTMNVTRNQYSVSLEKDALEETSRSFFSFIFIPKLSFLAVPSPRLLTGEEHMLHHISYLNIGISRVSAHLYME